MEGKNYSAVPPPPSLTDKETPVNFSDALSRARAIAEKLKQTTASTTEQPQPPQQQPSSSTGTKRGYEDSSPSTSHQQDDRENKRSAYDSGASRPSYVSNEPRRYGLGSEERRPTSNYGTNSGRQEEYKVPNHMVGLLIGKGGENLKKIERMSGVSKVQFAAARDMIRQMVEDAKVTEANRSGATTAPPAGGYHHHHHHYGGAAGGNTMTIRIPVPKVGLVIGRGGETIREFEQQSRAKILLSSDSSNDINNERAITLLGDDAAVQHAKHLIEELVYGSPNLSAPRFASYGLGHTTNPNDQRIYVPIPSTVVGLIIGRGGETIRYFQEQSGARVKVDLSGDPNAEERNVCITGEPQALAVAKRLVEEKVAEQFQQYDYSQYYAQYGYDQYQAYSQYNYAGYQQPTTATEAGNGTDLNNIAEQAAAYYAHYYGQPQTQEQKEAYNQWFQQYYGHYYNQTKDASSSTDASNEKEDKEQPLENKDESEQEQKEESSKIEENDSKKETE
ncbi:hypothetical protein BCV72DRAFT_216521 [Rhizopus microsporus var. microsporus]|uniref:K Homology domain-containing protein n=1 Tax=Rhizopus microsporus var. microsporus TaxID=86635 RepID=A0A1X0QQ28_RHIZD|nr:hypothetical protein BCV72DRAFT_216521 [Rhizopus microsporus var. microsporus]